MQRKYEFTGETKTDFGRTLNRIRRISDGLVGGWIENESNLSHEGECFVYDNARVFGSARVFDNATVSDNARVFDNATVSDNARVSGSARVFDNATVSDNATVFDNATVSDNARVSENATVFGSARVFDNATVSGSARVFDNATVSGSATVKSICSETPKFIQGFSYNITITDHEIHWGCRDFDADSITRFTFEDCEQTWIEQIFNDELSLVKLAAGIKWGVEL